MGVCCLFVGWLVGGFVVVLALVIGVLCCTVQYSSTVPEYVLVGCK